MQRGFLVGIQSRFTEFDVDTTDRAGEREGRGVVTGDRRAGVAADPEGVDAEPPGDGAFDAVAGNLTTVDRQHGVAAPTRSATDLGWLRRTDQRRVVRLTEAGRHGLHDTFGVPENWDERT